MFVRVIKARSNEYVSIIKGYRDKDGKVKHKTVYNLGIVTEKTKEATIELGKRIIAHTKGHEIISSPEDIEEIARENWGAPEIIESLWNKFALSQVLTNETSNKAIKLMLMDRFLSPQSKLQTFYQRQQYPGYADVGLQHLYRSLDQLHEHKEELQSHIYNKQKLYGNIDVVFFDVTTLYFESQKADDLKEFGFSKDCKFNEVQIVLSLVVNNQGRPLSYEIFPGNTFEGKTLLPCLKRLKEKFEINKVIIVADRGIGSEANLEAIKEAGFDYIIGSRLRSASSTVQNEALNQDGYQNLYSLDEDSFKYKFLSNKNWLCLWSAKRAEKDAKDRERLLNKAYNMIESGMVKDQRGAKKYIKYQDTSKEEVLLDLERAEKDALFDGYYTLSYSDVNLTAQEIASAYHNLWRVEESFRTLKSFFNTRPMFHWTAKRISGHIMLNFIALVLEIDLELLMQAQDLGSSHMQIRYAIKAMQRSILRVGESRFYSYAKLENLQIQILNLLHIHIPKNSSIKS